MKAAKIIQCTSSPSWDRKVVWAKEAKMPMIEASNTM